MASKRETWLGGYIRRGKKGPTYVIERWIGGVHFHVSTKCRTERAALQHLARFEASTTTYKPAQVAAGIVKISAALVDHYEDFMRNEKHNTEEWISDVRRYLGDWADDLAGKNLRALTIADLKRPLDRRKTSRKHRIEAIKAFCAWLRKEQGLLTHAEDRTLDLAVPQVSPTKHKRRRVVDDKARLFNALQKLPEATADVLLLKLGTAWHNSEVRRFARSGEILPSSAPGHLAVLVVKHKSGDTLSTPITAMEHLEAAKRIRARGKIPSKESLSRHMREAHVGFHLADIRATVLTHAVQMGATPQQSSEFAHHRSLATTKRHYIDLAVPTVTVPVLRLVKEDEEKAG